MWPSSCAVSCAASIRVLSEPTDQSRGPVRRRSDAKPCADSSVCTVLWSWPAAPTSLTPPLTENRGSLPERVHTNPLPLLKRSLNGQDLWTGVTGLILNHAGQSNPWLKLICQTNPFFCLEHPWLSLLSPCRRLLLHPGSITQ